MCTHTELIERVKAVVEDSGYTQSAFARKAGIETSNFSKMMSGKQKITVRTCDVISARYGISRKWLIEGVGDMHDKDAAQAIVENNYGKIGRIGHNIGNLDSDIIELRKENEMLKEENRKLWSLLSDKIKNV